MKAFLKLVLSRLLGFTRAWIPAALLTTALGTMLQTQNVLAQLSAVGADVGLGSRLSMTAYDLLHFGSFYMIFIALGTLVAYLVGLVVYRFARTGRSLIFAVAGGTAILVMLIGMKEAFFGVDLVAGARDPFGYSLQVLSGAIGGFVFAKISAPNARTSA